MKKFLKFKLSRNEAAKVLGGGDDKYLQGPSKKPRPVEEPTAQHCATLGCEYCYSESAERHYCCNCDPE